MTHFKPYSAYRCSGADWFGAVPEQWDAYPGKRIFSQSRVPSSTYDEQLTASQKYGVIPQQLYMEKEGHKVALALAGSSNFKHVEKDDFVISLRSFQGGIERSHYPGSVTPAYTVLRSARKEFVPGYYEFLLKTTPYVQALQASTDSLRDGKAISYDAFGRIPLPVPPLPTQQAIAAFLDRETARIDALIEKKKLQIELLKEKRQAIITQAVTKGLDPNVPMKDSGVEWLGEVPEHWRVVSLGYKTKITTGATPDRNNLNYWEGDIPWVKTGEVNYTSIVEAEEHITIDGLLNSSTRLAPKGTLLIAMYGQGVTRGRVGILGINATFNQACAALETEKSIDNEYLLYFMMAAYPFIRKLGNETSQKNLNVEIISKIKILVPPKCEQMEISQSVKNNAKKYDQLSKKVAVSIGLLKERRSALITAAVTGQIDVRGK